MIEKCEIINDLLPLYVDGICSSESCAAVEEHVASCKKCASLLDKYRISGPEKELSEEKNEVIEKQAKRFRKRSAAVGTVIAGILMIPVLVCFIVNLATGAALDWFFIVLASLLVTASLTVVPLMVPENKALMTLGAFTASLLLLLGVCCIYTGGKWFFVASSAVLFGLSVVFLPFAARSEPFRKAFGNCRGLLVMGVITVLYALMMLSIGLYTKEDYFFRMAFGWSFVPVLYAWLTFVTARYIPVGGLTKAGIICALTGAAIFCMETVSSWLIGNKASFPRFCLNEWNEMTLNGNILWTILLAGLGLGIIFSVCGIIRRIGSKKEK